MGRIFELSVVPFIDDVAEVRYSSLVSADLQRDRGRTGAIERLMLD